MKVIAHRGDQPVYIFYTCDVYTLRNKGVNTKLANMVVFPEIMGRSCLGESEILLFPHRHSAELHNQQMVREIGMRTQAEKQRQKTLRIQLAKNDAILLPELRGHCSSSGDCFDSWSRLHKWLQKQGIFTSA